MRTSAPPKEPALSRPKHLAPESAPSGSSGTGTARHALTARNRSRLLLLLAMVCAGLLIAAPLAIVFSGGSPEAGGTRNPDGVFQGGTDDGTGRGGGAAATVTTPAASQSAAPAGGDQGTGGNPAAGGAGGGDSTTGGGSGGGGGTVRAGGGGTGAQPNTAAGAPAPALAAQQPAQQ